MAHFQNICHENTEYNYKKYENVGNKVYQEYEQIHKEMGSKLTSNLLQPFAKTLMEHEKFVLKDQDKLVQTIRDNLQEEIQEAFNNFWRSNSVSDALITLEICKEKFTDFEGHKWNMDAKTPRERTRPIRMRCKESCLRLLETQLNSQNKQLEEVLQENAVLRQNLQDVKNQRSSLLGAIGSFRKKCQLVKREIMVLQEKIVPEDYEDIEPESNSTQ